MAKQATQVRSSAAVTLVFRTRGSASTRLMSVTVYSFIPEICSSTVSLYTTVAACLVPTNTSEAFAEELAS